jgi:hypothetical protein
MFHFYIPEGICFAAFIADSFRNIKVKHYTHLKIFLQEYKSETSYTPEDIPSGI